MRYTDLSEEEYCNLVTSRINKFMIKNNLKQKELVKYSGIGQSTLSKILKGEIRLTLQHIFKISKALEITPEMLLSFDEELELLSYDQNDTGLINKKYIDDQILIRNTCHPAFKGYIDNIFNVYCYSTISSETLLLEGKLSFEDSECHNYCKAKLLLCTGQKTKDGNPVFKKYMGELVISLTMGSCYAYLINSEIGECILLNFIHTFLFNQELKCRIATMSSTSSGATRLPVIQRMILSKEKLNVNDVDSSDYEFVRGQLKLNDSTIIMPTGSLQKLLNTENILNSELGDYLKKCREFLDMSGYEAIEEGKIRGIEASSDIKAQAISLLRNASIAPKYNKISTKTEEFVYQYIDNKTMES